MLAAALAFTLGAILLQRLEIPPSLWWILAVLPPTAFAVVFRRRPSVRIGGWILLSFAAGFGWANFLVHQRLADAAEFPDKLKWRDIAVQGIVTDLPKESAGRIQFQLQLEKIIPPNSSAIHPDNLRARLAIYKSRWPNAPTPQAGEKWEFTVRLRPPKGFINPHGFNSGGRLFARGIHLVGYVRQNGMHRKIADGQGLNLARRKIRARIFNAIPKSDSAGILAALIVGDRSQISDSQWQILRRTGTAHLVSISGAHITMVSGLVFLLAAAIFRRIPQITRRIPAAKAAILLALIAAFFYALIAGFALPAQRAFLMFAVFVIAMMAGNFTSKFTPFGAALFAVVAADPWAVLSAGFWLSFFVVAIILLVFAVQSDRPKLWKWLAAPQIIIVFAVAPLVILFFGEAPLLASPPANFLAIPWVGFIVLPLALADLIFPGDFLWRLADWSLSPLLFILNFLSATPLAVWAVAEPPIYLVGLALVGGFWLAMPTGFPTRILGIIPLAALFGWMPPSPELNSVRITVLDVGQGIAAVVRTKNHSLLYDAGPNFGETDAGRIVVLPFLRGEGIRKLNMLVVSHGDSDHAGGKDSVMEGIAVDELISSAFFPEAKKCIAGKKWQWDGVGFEFLHPTAADYESKKSDNALSCVLKITAGGRTMLFTGDIPSESEAEILSREGDSMASDILLVPHHGSRFSSSAEFVEGVSAAMAVFSVGRNWFGHPHDSVLERFADAEIYRTDSDGAIQIDISAEGIKAVRWGDINRRYWRENSPIN